MKTTILCLNVLVGVVLLAVGCTKHEKYPDQEPFHGALAQGDSLVHPLPQFASNRQFEGLASEKNLTLSIPPGKATDESPQEMVMKMPIQVAVDPDEAFIFVMDKETFRINKISLSDGSLLKSITEVQKYKKRSGTSPMLQGCLMG